MPTVPPRGPLTVSAAAVDEILAGIKAPPGFEVKVFAAPPIVNYPACITATLAGELFVCVDRNSSLQADPGMGSVLRLVDRNHDGQADDYTVFASMDSPRGAVFDGETLYVTHPPYLTAYRDADGDGIAEESRTLVRGLGFGLDFRGADHTVNGVEIGRRRLALRRRRRLRPGQGGRRRRQGNPDAHAAATCACAPTARGLEIYARGTRNDYDLAIDPYLNLFARGNTNDGGGWDIRLNHFVAGGKFGYPSLFRNFGDEVVAPLADYGGGSGTGMLFVQDPGLPAPFGDTLYSVDWGTNFIYRHPLQPRGATFTAGQEVFLGLPRPTDFVLDGASRLYVASWKGGQYRYGGEQIGYIARLTYPGAKAVAGARPQGRERRAARRARRPRTIRCTAASRSTSSSAAARRRTASRCSRSACSAPDPLRGSRGRDLHVEAAGRCRLARRTRSRRPPTPTVREFALRALADRRERAGQRAEGALPAGARRRQSPRAAAGHHRAQAAGRRRRRRRDPAAHGEHRPASVAARRDRRARVARRVGRGAGACWPPPRPLRRVTTGALRVLQQIHSSPTVTGLIDTLAATRNAQLRAGILQALARLHYRDGVWRGTLAEWWGTRPDTTGPYYDPVAWDRERAHPVGSARAPFVTSTTLRRRPRPT